MNLLRKNIHFLIILWAAFSLAACTKDELVQPSTPQEIEAAPGSIVLTLPGTARALADGQEDTPAQSTEPEAKVARMDVLVFPDEREDDAACVFHKRFTANEIKTVAATGDGEATSYVVMAGKSEFEASTHYKVYVLANAREDTREDLDAFLPADGAPKTLADLKTLVVTTERVYLTGIDRYMEGSDKPNEGEIQDPDIPKYFLMDATATSTDQGTDASAPIKVESLTLNDGDLTSGTKIYATLHRAAAKVTLILRHDTNVKFPPNRGWLPKVAGAEGGEPAETTDESAAAYFRMTPTNIRIDAFAFDPLTGASDDGYLPVTATLRTEDTPIFVENVGADEISTWTYAYPHRWEGSASTYAEGSYLVVRIPIFYNSEGNLEADPSDATWTAAGSGDDKEWTTEVGTRYFTNNYYKIPMGKDSHLDRNTHYVVSGTISAPGSTQPDTPVELENIDFQVVEWIPQDVNVGDDADLHYLYVNKEEYSIRNVEEDHTLTFSSSLPVEITVEEAYFTDREGTNKYYYQNGNKTTDYKNAKGETLDLEITATADNGSEALSGGITLHSPVPNNNLPRIIKLKITNDAGDTEYVTITQYPLDWIQYTEGAYSYWDDDQWSTYDYKRIGRDAPSTPYTGAWRDTKDPDNWTGTDIGDFAAKYVKNQGGSEVIWSYKYAQSNYYPYDYVLSDGNTQSNWVDYRMYHIQITSTSDEYVIGRPKLDANGHTMAGEDNAKVVSPSFMINSQLGAKTGNVADNENQMEWAHAYADHYAEVFVDPETGEKRVYRDWRLPTAAEIRIISKFQGTDGTLGSTPNNQADAMFIVMNGRSYCTANGMVINGTEIGPDGNVIPNFPNATDYAIRLVRDVYEDKDGDPVGTVFQDTRKWQKNE